MKARLPTIEIEIPTTSPDESELVLEATSELELFVPVSEGVEDGKADFVFVLFAVETATDPVPEAIGMLDSCVICMVGEL